MKIIKVRNGNEIIINGDEIKPVLYNGDCLSLGKGAKCALAMALIDGLAFDEIETLICHMQKVSDEKFQEYQTTK